MKKRLILFTLIFLLLTLCACVNKRVDVNNNGTNSGTTGSDDSTDTTDPDDSTDTTGPDDSTDTTDPDDSTDITGPDDSTDTTGPDDSTDTTGPDDSTDTTDPDDSTDTTEPDDSTGSEDNREDTAYQDIERHQAEGYKTDYYGFSDDSMILSIEHPTEWSFRKVNGGFDILRADMIIGCLVMGEPGEAEEWTPLEIRRFPTNDIDVQKYIERKYVDGEAQYRYRYVYNYSVEENNRTITLITLCEELDATSEEKLIRVNKQKKSTSKTLGILSDRIDNCSSILILGNSFVGTSSIGESLNEMLRINGKNCYATAISRGHATVATYINDSSLMDSIRNGVYDVVFICGFYGYGEVTNLGILKSVCDQSNTELVIFPAHNESDGVLAFAKIQYPSIVRLNWKDELDGLITIGVNRWDLCINDYYNHSNALAGYVGAHMIYRAIYNEIPRGTMQYPLEQSYIDSILGDYVSTGYVEIIDEDKITYLD